MITITWSHNDVQVNHIKLEVAKRNPQGEKQKKKNIGGSRIILEGGWLCEPERALRGTELTGEWNLSVCELGRGHD